MSWLLYTLLAINLWCVSNIIDKHVMSRQKRIIAPLVITSFFSVFYAAGVFMAFKSAISLIGIALGFAWFPIILIYLHAMRTEEASRVVAHYALIPVFVAVMAYFLFHETFGLQQYLAISVIILATALISLKRTRPNRIFLIMTVFAAIYAAVSIAMKYATTEADFASVFASMELGQFLVSLPFLIIFRAEISKTKKRTISLRLASQFIGAVGFASLVYAISIGPISLVSAVENAQPAFLFVYASAISFFRPKIIREDISRKNILLKAAAIALMLAGVYLLV